VPAGPYIVLPIFGPSSVRDAPARLADDYTNARHYIKDPYVDWGLWGIGKLEVRASLLDLDAALDRTFDPYAFVRGAWIQRREFLVRDGESAPDSDLVDPEAPDAPPPN
jgi:phospholipid-binding lipoprotein MlaA